MASTASASPPTLVDVVGTKALEDKLKPNSVSTWCLAQWKPILAELISTAMLVFFGCMSCIPIDGLTQQSPIYAPLGFGLAVMFNVQIFGHISGAHMNPAVTLAAVIWGNTSIVLGICYFVVQVLGATIGYGILIGLAPIDVAVDGICVTHPHVGLNGFQTLGVEIILTGTVSFICCALWDPVNQHKQDSVPIKFGLAITGLSIAGAPLTGASMNPARSLGPALWTGIWTVHWAYWAGPFIGAALTAVFYKYILLQNHKNV